MIIGIILVAIAAFIVGLIIGVDVGVRTATVVQRRKDLR
jgi:uncharacterized integral membrane protein